LNSPAPGDPESTLLNVEQTRTTPSLRQRLSQPFVTGVLALIPLALTLAVVVWVVVFVHDLVGPSSFVGRILGSIGLNFVACEVIAYTIGVAVTIALVYFWGLLVEGGLGRRSQFLFEGALRRVPLVSTVYDASKNLTSMFDRKDENVKAMAPVLCYLGGDGGNAVLGLMPTPERIRIDGQDYHVVIVPTAPVPIGGFLLCVPVDHVKPAGCSFDGLVNVFMSMGASAPDYLGTRPDTETGSESE
jgi:uncharacterized membrane protein